MKPTVYDLMIQIHDSVNRLEDKLDKRINGLEGRLQLTETKLDTMIGKIGVGVIILTLVASMALSFVMDMIKKLVGK